MIHGRLACYKTSRFIFFSVWAALILLCCDPVSGLSEIKGEGGNPVRNSSGALNPVRDLSLNGINPAFRGGAPYGAEPGIILKSNPAKGGTAEQRGIISNGVKVEVKREWKGAHCGYREPERLVIKTEDQWREVWKKIHHLQLPTPELPVVDFKKEMVIAVFMGERKSGGYEIEIKKIAQREKEIIVEVEEREPPPESIQTQALTQPYHLIVIHKLKGVTHFTR